MAPEFDGDRRSRTVYTAEPEADLVERLGEIQRRFDVSMGCYPDREAGHNRLKLTADDGTALADVAAWLADNVALVDR